MATSRKRVAALLILTFAAGAAAGIAADRLRLVPGEATAGEASQAAQADDPGGAARADEEARPGRRGGDEDDRRDEGDTTIERFADELGLTAEQRAEIEEILEDHRASVKQMWSEVRPRYRALMDTARTRIEAVLTPQQVEAYRALLERRHGDDDHDDRKESEKR